MAPALTKVLKDGHGIHLSSPPASVGIDSNRRLVHTELDPHLRLTEDSDPQEMWLNLSLFTSLESVSPLDVPANPLLSPCLQAAASECETLSPPSPSSLLGLLSFNKGLGDSHQGVSFLPDVPDMFLGLIPEHNSQEACLLHGCGDAPKCGPDGVDVHHSSLTHASLSPLYSLREVKSQGYGHVFATSPTVTHKKEAEMGCLPASRQYCNSRMKFDRLASRAILEESLKEQLSRRAGLHNRAWRLQKRLETLLAEHTLLHCNQQLEGLKRYCEIGDVSPDSLDSIHPGVLLPQAGSEPNFSWVELSTASSSLTELREFSFSSQAVLRSLQETLDSEATASSSSDEELEERKNHNKRKKISSVSSSNCERQWLEERAELGSRWSWLQLRLAELEGRIQQLVELHNHIRSSKGGVVLGESQPQTDRQIQQTLLQEMGGLSCTDADTEHCSPTRLLHNIERQSAQLSQIVNSLMPPLSFSPLSKQAQTWKDKSSFKSGQKADNGVMPGSSKRRKLGSRRLFKADVSCVCARTRPLVTHHKPRLFTFSTHTPTSTQDSRQSTSSYLLSSSSSCCSSCDPVVLFSDPDCSSSWTLSSRNPSSRPHSVSSLSFDTTLSHHLQRSLGREEWSQKPLVSVSAQSPASSHYNRCSSTPLPHSHKYKQHARHNKSKVIDLSPIRRAGYAQRQYRRAKQRKRKRRHIHWLLEDEEDSLYQLCDLQESSDELLEESYTCKQASQGFVRKRQGESVYNINNIVIPMSMTKVEKLQYKDILTPRWRMFNTFSLSESKTQQRGDSAEGQVEDLSDETFAQRHLALEQREKLRWPSWGKRKCCRRPTRSGSRLSGSGGTVCTSGEESSVEWSSAQLDTDEQPNSEEWLPQAPWELRVFPLDEDKEEALLSYNSGKIPSGWSESSFASFTSKNSNSHVSVAQSSGVRPPSDLLVSGTMRRNCALGSLAGILNTQDECSDFV